jgi:hypothetical protein
MARRRLTASAIAAALALGAAMSAAMVLAAGCSSPEDLMDAAKKDVKKSFDMFLTVKDKSPADNSSDNSPETTLYIDFDRALDTGTVTASNVKLHPSSNAGAGGGEVPWTWSYDQALKRLYISPGLLDGGVSYLVSLGTGLRSSKGESLDEEYSWNFATGMIPHGSIAINGGAAYALNATVTLTIAANNLVDKYFYSLAESDVTNPSHAWWSLSGSTVTASNFLSGGDKAYTLYYQFISAAGAVSKVFSTSIILDTTAPNAPSMLSGPTSSWTASHYPSWSWTTGGNGGNGVFRYYVSGTGWSGDTTDTSCAPALADGSYSFLVRERDAAGNWSGNSTAFTSVTVNAPPIAPTVSSTALTVDDTPTWTWTPGGFGNGMYQYQLDSTSGSWTATTNASYTSGTLANGSHTLYVQERDAGGEWSASGSKAITIYTYLPYSGQTGVPTRRAAFQWRDTSLLVTYYFDIKDVEGNWVLGTRGISSPYEYSALLSPRTTYTWRIRKVPNMRGGTTTYLPSITGTTFTTNYK